MTPATFARTVIDLELDSSSATVQGAYLVLVDGLSSVAAARQVGKARQTVNWAVTRIRAAAGEARRCPECGQTIHQER